MYLCYSISLVPGANLFVLIVSFGLLQLGKGKIESLAGKQSNAFSLVSAEAVEKFGPTAARDASASRQAMVSRLVGNHTMHHGLFLVPSTIKTFQPCILEWALVSRAPYFFC